MDRVIKVNNLTKKYPTFTLGELSFKIPKGFITALVGTNGSGKSTLLEILAGVIYKTKGNVSYFDTLTIDVPEVKNKIGYVSDSSYFPDNWNIFNIGNAMEYGFDNFNKQRFYELCKELKIIDRNKNDKKELKKIYKLPNMFLSQGMQMRLMLAAQLARTTEFLILDEPTSHLDPIMRDELCDTFRDYIKDGEKSILFSTHNVTDVENVTDYVIIMDSGKIIEQGFTEDLKQKYKLINGNSTIIEDIAENLIFARINDMGFSGLCENSDVDKIKSNHNINVEIPTLQQIVVALLKGVADDE